MTYIIFKLVCDCLKLFWNKKVDFFCPKLFYETSFDN